MCPGGVSRWLVAFLHATSRCLSQKSPCVSKIHLKSASVKNWVTPAFAPKLPCFWLPLGLNPGTRFQSPPQAQTWGVRPPSRRRMAFSTSEQIRTTKPPTPQQTHGPQTGPCSMQGQSRASCTQPPLDPRAMGPLEGEAMGLAASKALARGS